MFNFMSEHRNTDEISSVRPSRPSPVSLQTNLMEALVPAGYADLCIDLGVCFPQILQVMLQKFLFDKEIPRYDSNQVGSYLLWKCRTARVQSIVKWRPLRPCDRNSHKSDLTPTYDKIVPMRILESVKVIRDEFPSAKFLVSDIIADPDPFIAAHFYEYLHTSDFDNGNLDRLVIFGVWDEPGFSG